MIMTLISTKTIRELEPSLAPASQPGPTIVGGVRCSVDSSGEVLIIIFIVIITWEFLYLDENNFSGAKSSSEHIEL